MGAIECCSKCRSVPTLGWGGSCYCPCHASKPVAAEALTLASLRDKARARAQGCGLCAHVGDDGSYCNCSCHSAAPGNGPVLLGAWEQRVVDLAIVKMADEPPKKPDPYATSALKDQLGEKDARIRALEAENAALALELRRATRGGKR